MYNEWQWRFGMAKVIHLIFFLIGITFLVGIILLATQDRLLGIAACIWFIGIWPHYFFAKTDSVGRMDHWEFLAPIWPVAWLGIIGIVCYFFIQEFIDKKGW